MAGEDRIEAQTKAQAYTTLCSPQYSLKANSFQNTLVSLIKQWHCYNLVNYVLLWNFFLWRLSLEYKVISTGWAGTINPGLRNQAAMASWFWPFLPFVSWGCNWKPISLKPLNSKEELTLIRNQNSSWCNSVHFPTWWGDIRAKLSVLSPLLFLGKDCGLWKDA